MKKNMQSQRGYYSEICPVGKNADSTEKKKVLSGGTAILQSLYCETTGWKHTPSAKTFEFPSDVKIKSLKPESIPEQYKLFFEKSYEPKIQLPYHTLYGSCPKRLAVERLKIQYAEKKLKDLLQNLGIDNKLLQPQQIIFKGKGSKKVGRKWEKGIPKEPFLPLDVFDDTEYELNEPQDWMKLGIKSILKKPIPALCFLPLESFEDEELTFDWQDVAVLDYNASIGMYLVRKKTDCPEEGVGVISRATMSSEGDKHDFWVPRIYLMFYAEDPFMFSKRVASAVKYRQKAEESLRFSLYIDCMPRDGVPVIEKQVMDRIFNIACTTSVLKHLEYVEEYIPEYINEIHRNYQRTLNSMTFKKVAQQIPCLLDEIPDSQKKKPDMPMYGYKIPVDYSFAEKRSDFVRRTFLNKVEIIQARHSVRDEILSVTNRQLFQVPISNAMRIEEFEKLQNDILQQVNMYTHDSWLKNLAVAIQSKLLLVGKGWFNLHEKNWFAYQSSKMKKFMNSVNYMMQDSLRFLINSSLGDYTQMISDACYNIMDLTDTYKWSESYRSDHLRPLKNPIFEIDMLVVGTEAKFSVELIKYPSVVLKLFNKGLKSTKDIPQIEKRVLEDIFFGEKLVVENVGEHEPHIEAWRETIAKAMEKSLIAMKAYVESFAPVLQFGNTDPQTYVKEFSKQKRPAQELKDLIDFHLKEKQRLDAMIPDKLAVGPFLIITRSVRQNTVKKHSSLADALLSYFSEKLHDCMEDIKCDFLTLRGNILLKPGTIEDLLDQEKELYDIPNIIAEYQERIHHARQDYLLLEEFNCNLTSEDFSLYWLVVSHPYEATSLLKERLAHLDDEKSALYDFLIQDQSKLSDGLDSMVDKIAGLSTYCDIDKATIYANEVRHIDKQLMEYKEKAKLYNMREELFNLDITDYSKIDKRLENLEPYRLLWLSVSDFYKWRERDLTDQLNIEKDQLRFLMEKYYDDLGKCPELFEEYREILDAIFYVRKEMDDYRYTSFSNKKPSEKGLEIEGVDEAEVSTIISEMVDEVSYHLDKIFVEDADAGSETMIGNSDDPIKSENESIEFEDDSVKSESESSQA